MIQRDLKTIPDVVDWGLCVGCGACAVAAKNGDRARMVHVEADGFRPVFDDARAAASAELLQVCPGAHVNGNLMLGDLPKQTEADHEFGPTLQIWEGWATDPEIRFKASSGGLLTALSLYCIEQEGYAGAIHAGMDPSTPWMNRNYISRDRAGVLARAGSRYAPSAPVAALNDLGDGSHVFIGKPCDASAVSELRQRDAALRRKIGLVLTFFCAGTPSTRGTLDLMDGREKSTDPVTQVHYRGEGWPGDFRVVGDKGVEQQRLSYQESWGRLTAYRPLRCNLCPDGLGRVADIACGDAWHRYKADGDKGRSLVLVRTERGREILERAQRAGYITLQPAGSDDVLRAQKNLLDRRRALFGRLAAFRALGAPIPSFEGFSLFRGWRQSGFKNQAKTLLGTLRRIAQRGWYRRRTTPARTPETVHV